MKTPHLILLVAAVAALGVGDFANSQVTSTGDTSVNDTLTPRNAPGDGILKFKGNLYIVSLGVARRIELGEGQMVTMDGVVHNLPANYRLPTVPGAGTGAPGTGSKTPVTGPSDPTPGATTPGTR